MSTITTRVFMNGNSQAVRIPREFRLNTNQVEIFRSDTGDLIIHPVPESRGQARSTRKPQVVRKLGSLIRQVPVLYDVGATLCRHYAEQSARLKVAGTPVGANDLWIACITLFQLWFLFFLNLMTFTKADQSVLAVQSVRDYSSYVVDAAPKNKKYYTSRDRHYYHRA